MGSTAFRTAAVALLVLMSASLAGCARVATGDAGTVDACTPRWPQTSADVARAGDVLTVSVSGASCRPRFEQDRRLVLTWVDHAGHRSRLATVHAYPSAAFEQEVRIPRSTATGLGGLSVTGVEVPCPPNASCAAYEAGVTVVDSEPDFSSGHANGVAADVAERMEGALEHRPSFAEVRIVPDGIEATLHTRSADAETAVVRQELAAARAAVPAGDRALARQVHLHLRFSRHGRATLERLTTRLLDDRPWQQRHGLDLTAWGPDPATDSVRIALRHYSDAAAILLTGRYGDAVTVSTRSVQAVAS